MKEIMERETNNVDAKTNKKGVNVKWPEQVL